MVGRRHGTGDYLSPLDLRAFVAAEQPRPGKQHRPGLAALRSFFRYLIQEADLPHNPAEGCGRLAAPGACRAPSMWMLWLSS